MINLNEIAFIDTDGFDYNDGECLVRFDTVMYCPDKKLILYQKCVQLNSQINWNL